MADGSTTFGGTLATPKSSGADWTIVRRMIAAWLRDPGQFKRKVMARECPMCGYRGMFISVGRPSRWDSRCPKCASRERHRLTELWKRANGCDPLLGERILHFAPEKAVRRQMRGNPLYETADLQQRGVTHQMDITAIPAETGAFGVVIAHHVLEHIDDDRAAIREIYRVLKPGGFAMLTVPLNGTRQETYENPTVKGPIALHFHFGGWDHKRLYGLDFSDRLESIGFDVETFRASPADEPRFGLLRDEWLYIARKPSASV